MARNYVTRTVHGTNVTVKVVDTNTEQIIEETYILNKGYPKIDENLKKQLIKSLPNDRILVSILKIEEVNKCYGVPVADFMAQAIELNPTSRTAVATEAE